MLNGVNERWPNTILRRLTISICLLHFLYMHESGFESADNESTIVNSAQRNTQCDRNKNRKEERKLCAIFWFCLHQRRRRHLVLVCGCSYSYVHRLDKLCNSSEHLQLIATHIHTHTLSLILLFEVFHLSQLKNKIHSPSSVSEQCVQQVASGMDLYIVYAVYCHCVLCSM